MLVERSTITTTARLPASIQDGDIVSITPVPSRMRRLWCKMTFQKWPSHLVKAVRVEGNTLICETSDA